ncbi:MAG: response regulator [Candidatus Paceibacterota bacterium]
MDETTQTPGEGTNTAESVTSESPKKVLAVEDDLFLKELLAGKLSDDEFNVFYASNGDEALTIASTELPDVILLDILLPGMSGYEVLEKLKADENTKNIPVIILSNFGQPEDIEKGKALGAVDFLVKANNSLDAIVSRVREIATSPQA